MMMSMTETLHVMMKDVKVMMTLVSIIMLHNHRHTHTYAYLSATTRPARTQGV